MPSARLTRGRAARGRVQVQQLARLAPGAVRHHQQEGLTGGLGGHPRQRSRLLAGKQQAGPVARHSPGLLGETLADPQFRIAQAEHGQPCGIQHVPDLAGVLQDQHPRTRRQEGINAQRQWLAGRAQRSQRIRDMGRLLEGAQCATGGGILSLAKRHISDEWQQLSSPIKNSDEFCRSMKNTIVPPSQLPSVRAEDWDEPLSIQGCFSCSLASTDR